MTDVDLPGLDSHIAGLTHDIRSDLAERGKRDLMFFGKGVLGYKDMTHDCHGPLCVYINTNKAQFKLILHPRDTFKTSVVTISGNLQKYLCDHEERILIGNESATNAERFLRAIRQHAESNRVFRALYSEVIPNDTRRVRWNDSELDFVRQGHYPEPTFDSIGMTGSVTSRHYTHICFDDPISEEAVKSPLVMQDTINRMSALTALLTKPEYNTVWLVGTRWALHDVYSWYEKTFALRLSKFARGIVEEGKIIFPELISEEMLAIKRSAMGEYKFSCLMMNNPRNDDLQDLNVQDLRFFSETTDECVAYTDRDGADRRVRISDLDVTVTVDLAPAERTTSDRNAVVALGVTPWNEALVLEAWGARCTPLELIEKLFDLHKRYHPRRYGIEGVAYQKAFKYFLKQECERRGEFMRVEELKAVGKKEIRIRGLQPIMATGRLFIKGNQHLLRNEMADFPLGEHDDVVDALAMQLQMLRGQLSPEYQEKLERETRRLAPDYTRLREQLDLDPEEAIDKDFLPQNWQEVVLQ